MIKNKLLKIFTDFIGLLAHLIIKKFNPDIIAVTGSAGKTSAKEAIYAVLSNSKSAALSRDSWNIRRSKGNLNNELGVPLAVIADWKDKCLALVSRGTAPNSKKIGKIIFWLKAICVALWKIVFGQKNNYPDVLILEFGADRPGDIRKLLKIAKPKIGVITAIGKTPSHVEYYENAEEVLKEKSKIIENLKSDDWGVFNFDDDMVMKAKEKFKGQSLTFGFNDGADVKISNFENRSIENRPDGVFFKIEYQGNIIPVNIKNVFGRPQAYAIAAAFAVGIIYNINLVEIAENIERHYLPAKRRMNLLEGLKGEWIIDDSYNASPLSVKEALNVLVDLKAERKIAVLGDMLELGGYSILAHESVGEMVSKIADVLITVGPRGKLIAEKAKENGLAADKIFSFGFVEEAIPVVRKISEKGDLILVKASRAVGLDKIVDEIRRM